MMVAMTLYWDTWVRVGKRIGRKKIYISFVQMKICERIYKRIYLYIGDEWLSSGAVRWLNIRK
jgi:hypothetical protein